VRAFHHHFRGMQGDALDAEDLRILYSLTQQIESGSNTRAVD
jgi:N-acetylmuramoyl-L-alanine amidase